MIIGDEEFHELDNAFEVINHIIVSTEHTKTREQGPSAPPKFFTDVLHHDGSQIFATDQLVHIAWTISERSDFASQENPSMILYTSDGRESMSALCSVIRQLI